MLHGPGVLTSQHTINVALHKAPLLGSRASNFFSLVVWRSEKLKRIEEKREIEEFSQPNPRYDV